MANLKQQYRLDQWVFNPDVRLLIKAGKEVKLQPKVSQLLEFLVQNPGRTVTREEIFSSVWSGRVVTDDVLSKTMSVLRSNLGDTLKNPRYIQTVSKAGYRLLIEPVTTEQEKREARAHRAPAAYLIGSLVILVGLLTALLLRPATPPARIMASAQTPLAVLPFQDRNEDPDFAHISDGMSDEIARLLSNAHNIKVIGPVSSKRVTRSDKSPGEIADSLNVQHLTYGNLTITPDREMHVDVRLIEAKSQDTIWTQQYHRGLDQLFLLERAIAADLAEVLQPDSESVPEARAVYAPEDFSAYEAQLLGKHRLRRRNVAALHEAESYFKRAIALDPNYAMAYVGLADTYGLLYEYGDLAYEDMLRKAEPLLNKAIVLDGSLGEAYASIGGLHRLKEELDFAERAFKRAIELSPNYPTAYQWYGYVLGLQLGRTKEGLAMLREAQRLDPLSPIINKNIADVLGSMGQLDAAMKQYHYTVEIDPNFAVAYRNLAGLYRAGFGQLDDASRWLQMAIDLDPTNPGFTSALALTALDLRAPDAAKYWIEQSAKIGSNSNDYKSAHMWYCLSLRQNHCGNTYAREILSGNPRDQMALLAKRIIDVQEGELDQAIKRYESSFPELLSEPIAISLANQIAAVDLAYLYRQTSQEEKAYTLESEVLDYLKDRPRLGYGGFEVLDVKIFLNRSEYERAMATLTEAINQGWKARSWIFFDHDQVTVPVKDSQVFQRHREAIHKELATMKEDSNLSATNESS